MSFPLNVLVLHNFFHKSFRKHCNRENVLRSLNFYSLGFSQLSARGASGRKKTHESEKIMRKCLIVQISRETRRWSEWFILRFSHRHRSVRYTGEYFMYIIETRRSLSARTSTTRGPPRYKTKIIFYFSNQLIFKFRCMRNASLSVCLRLWTVFCSMRARK